MSNKAWFVYGSLNCVNHEHNSSSCMRFPFEETARFFISICRTFFSHLRSNTHTLHHTFKTIVEIRRRWRHSIWTSCIEHLLRKSSANVNKNFGLKDRSSFEQMKQQQQQKTTPMVWDFAFGSDEEQKKRENQIRFHSTVFLKCPCFFCSFTSCTFNFIRHAFTYAIASRMRWKILCAVCVNLICAKKRWCTCFCATRIPLLLHNKSDTRYGVSKV